MQAKQENVYQAQNIMCDAYSDTDVRTINCSTGKNLGEEELFRDAKTIYFIQLYLESVSGAVFGINDRSTLDRCCSSETEKKYDPHIENESNDKSSCLSVPRSSSPGRNRINNIESISRLWMTLLTLSQSFYRSRPPFSPRTLSFSSLFKNLCDRRGRTIFWPNFKCCGASKKKKEKGAKRLVLHWSHSLQHNADTNSADLVGNLMQIVLWMVNWHILCTYGLWAQHARNVPTACTAAH